MHVEGWENQSVFHRWWFLCFHQKVLRAFYNILQKNKNNKCWLNVYGDGLYLFPNRDYSEWQTSIHSVPCRIKWVQSHNVTFMCLKDHIEVRASSLRCHYASPVLKTSAIYLGNNVRIWSNTIIYSPSVCRPWQWRILCNTATDVIHFIAKHNSCSLEM